ncbi:MAG: hypothetical protein L3I91_01210 [Mycoplasma sp.]
MIELKHFKRYLRINTLLSLINFFLLIWLIINIVLINVNENIMKYQTKNMAICLTLVMACYLMQMGYTGFWLRRMLKSNQFLCSLYKKNMIISLIPLSSFVTLIINVTLIYKLKHQCEDVDSHDELNF